MVVVVSGQRGSNSSDSWGSNSSDDRGSNSSGKWGGSIRAIDEGWVSLSFSITLGNDVSVVKPVGERSDKRGGSIGGQGGGGIAGQRGGSMVVGGQGKVMSVRVGTIGTISTIVTIGGD